MSEYEAPRPVSNHYQGLPPLRNHLQSESFNPFSSPRPRELLPSMMARSPPGRSTTLPPIPRPRPRKSSVTQNARKAKHERTKSKEHARRLSFENRKASSVEPVSQYKRWEDLIEAATSANEADSDRDLTPVFGQRSVVAFLLTVVDTTISAFCQTKLFTSLLLCTFSRRWRCIQSLATAKSTHSTTS